MKMTKTDFNVRINVSSSWIVYITKTREEASDLHKFALTQKEIMGGDWYYTVSTVDVQRDCRVPEFFHDHGYFATIIEHNNGDWDKPQKYELYIVEQRGDQPKRPPRRLRGQKGAPMKFIVEWTDHEGNLRQRTLNTLEDARLEAASLEEEFDCVAIITEVEV